uniref:AB hydrolase-1 domain-containing protein n=1 Tax=Kalanchoe fedtschenkoi TaxID=63787 RepID=A0A7N1A6Y2_KALFE
MGRGTSEPSSKKLGLGSMSSSPAKHHFVLIHGVGGGAWCWYKIHTMLESAGHQVTSLDLKGGGISSTDPNTVYTFEDYNQPFIDLLRSLPDQQQVIIVGHSAGGLSLTYAIHKFGCSKIKMAIYVAANMLRNGFCTPEDFKDGAPDWSEYGDVTEYIYALGPDQPPTGVLTKK